ncbi:endonuclease I family protein [Flexithrix dorotheae]|uniref:endonuclease I family protein n=1 Tax=Flexithrix dorotheae TaxID=70993 RepID=UPI0003688443|nr:endonuclease [Flexithrix dorotheae]
MYQFLFIFLIIFFASTCQQENDEKQSENSSSADSTITTINPETDTIQNESHGDPFVYSGYYEAINGLTGEALKDKLNDLIQDHKTFTYRNVYNILKELDRDPNNPENIIGIYSNFSISAEAGYADGQGWNREHVWAKSYGDFGTAPGAGTDLHHLRASDVSTNSARNNRTFDEAEDIYIDADGIKSGETGSYTSDAAWVWEPRNEVKGDVARMIFYMAVRYEGENNEPDLEVVDYIPSRGSKEPLHGKLSTLIRWHQEDPVSENEKRRNDLIYEKYQGNRNPFIDHPELVGKIWGN